MPQPPSDPLANSVATRWKVVARAKQADSIGNPKELLVNFMRTVAWLAEFESPIQALKAQRALINANPQAYSYPGATPEALTQVRNYKTALGRVAARLKGSPQSFMMAGVNRLFLALLQAYEFPAALRKKVEAGAKLYTKSRVLVPKDASVLEAYEKALAIHREYLQIAQEASQKGKPHGEGGSKQWKAGSFALVNTGGFDDATMERVSGIVEKAEKLMRAKGLGSVCYGSINVSNKLARGDVQAFYLPTKDEMFVRADIKSDEETVRVVIHELAHRMEEKSHKSKARAIATLHTIYGIQQDDTPVRVDSIPYPAAGMEIQQGKNLWQVMKVVGEKVYLIHDADPSKQASMTVDGWYRQHGAPVRRRKFITNYAKTSPSENFAEMVSFYCLGKLSAEQVEDLEKILYS